MFSSPSRPVHRRATSFGNRRLATEQVKRWDGAVRTSLDWDNLHKDPELWFRNGNCLIHLYGKGQSQRGPSFRVPFSGLLGAGCAPLIERFLATDDNEPRPQGADELRAWQRAEPRRTMELYIPPPSMADTSQAFYYHVATRNFLAWVFRRSMVGEQLGGALVGLLHSMHEFRDAGEDNVEDLMDYLDEEGYLDMAMQADYALAMVHLAEFFQMDELYARAFVHCVGMGDALCASTEYEHASLASKKLIRKARRDMDGRLLRAADLLQDFLDDELSEAHLGVPDETRLHLERFRSFLLSFYTTQLGYYPPRAFEADVLASMRSDFEALYDLLVDGAYSASEIMPSLAVGGGICTLQLVQSFDARNRYKPLAHPLPLLPQFSAPRGSASSSSASPSSSVASSAARRLSSWLPRPSGRIKPDQRFVAHASLIKASNWREHVFKNDLVRAYRAFEEASVVSPSKADRMEKVSLMDARKVRWILVYAVYQVLRSVTDAAPEAAADVPTAPYHLVASTEGLPPWRNAAAKDRQRLLRTQTTMAVRGGVSPRVAWAAAGDEGAAVYPGTIELKPDIDYFALTHPSEEQRGRTLKNSPSFVNDNGGGGSATPHRSRSLSRALSRSSTFRRSMRLFKGGPASMTPLTTASPVSVSGFDTPPTPQLAHREIIGDGHGTNETHPRGAVVDGLKQARAENTAVWVSRSGSTAGHSDASADTGLESLDSVAETLDSPGPPTPRHMPARICIPPADTATAVAGSRGSAHGGGRSPVGEDKSPVGCPVDERWTDVEVRPHRPRRRDVMSMMMPSLSSASLRSMPSRRGRAASVAGPVLPGAYSETYVQLVEQERDTILGGPSTPVPVPAAAVPEPPPRSSSRRAQTTSAVTTPTSPPSTTVTTASSIFEDLRRWSQYGVASHEAHPRAATPSVVIRDCDDAEEWAAMQAFMDGDDAAAAARGGVELVDDDVKPAWEQYADLGGLTEVR